MPKRLFAFVAAFALMFAIAGCSSGGSSASSASSDAGSSAGASVSASSEASSTSGSPLFTDQSWPADEHAAEGVPVPEFSVAPESIQTSENSVGGTWKGLEDQEVVDYVAALKGAGFTVKANENKSSTNYSYSAYNNEDILNGSNVMVNYTASIDGNPSALMIFVSRVN